ncbi:MAG: (Fe-S)-binding protein [Verrucomicrobia bacterium]|nr:(Fe-S)-binding protein [Verrucomicrobiota bacterium]MBV9642395.1 (Fe-S)-binding protein [Verrucomicrobiota bacterium]
MKINLLIPCFVDQLFPSVGISVVRIFEKLGHTVDFKESILCCGQPAFNAGFWDESRDIAVRVLQSLSGEGPVVVPSGSCTAMVKNFYPELFRARSEAAVAEQLSRRTFEFSSFLVDQLGVTDLGSRFPARVTFHDGCHGLRELQIKRQPRLLLERVKDLTLVEMEDQTSCCGFGGTFAVKFPMISTAMGETKSASALSTEAEYLVSNDSSCLMHLQGLLNRQNKKLKTVHLAEVLASY